MSQNYFYAVVSGNVLHITLFMEAKKKGKYTDFVKKGLLVCVIVLLLAAWWFIRNAILYHGDFLGRETSSACAELYARAKYKPSNSKTFQKKGDSMLCMIFYRPVYLEHDWLVTVLYSFVGAFGYNRIYLSKMKQDGLPGQMCLHC